MQARIEQAIAGQESSTLGYRLASLINFYRLTFERLLGSDSELLKTIQRYFTCQIAAWTLLTSSQ